MKRSDYGHAIEQYIRDHGPVSAAQIVDAVGCSRQRVYAWLTANRVQLREGAKTDHGAVTYSMRTAQLAGDSSTGRRSPKNAGEGVSMGDSVTVRAMRWHSGHLVLELVAEDGTELLATVQ